MTPTKRQGLCLLETQDAWRGLQRHTMNSEALADSSMRELSRTFQTSY